MLFYLLFMYYFVRASDSAPPRTVNLGWEGQTPGSWIYLHRKVFPCFLAAQSISRSLVVRPSVGPSVGQSVGPSVRQGMFVKLWPLEYQMVTKTHLHSNLCDSSDSRESNDSIDSCDSSDGSDSSDRSDNSD